MAYKIFFDGGCRPNPGKMEAAVVVRGVAHFFDDLGFGSSSDAEWLALIAALRLSQRGSGAIVLGDSAHVIGQATGLLAGTSQPSNPHHVTVLELAGGARPRLRWIRRSQNLAGIALERRRSGLA